MSFNVKKANNDDYYHLSKSSRWIWLGKVHLVVVYDEYERAVIKRVMAHWSPSFVLDIIAWAASEAAYKERL